MSSPAEGSRSLLLPLAVSALLLLTLASCSDPGKAADEAFANGEYERALDLWMPLAESGDAEAQFGVGYLYDEGLGVPKDGEEAVHWYRLAAEQGHETSQLNLGALYQSGRDDVPADPGRAADWYRMAAEQGNAKAQYYLGRLYYRGTGLPRNLELAFDWMKKAADQDNLQAINLLGVMYSRGLGVEQDAPLGLELVRQAAERGEATAQLNLAGLYVRGVGIEQDFVEALKWHRIFESHEIRGAGLPMGWVDNEMTAEEIAEAERRAEEWIAAHPAPTTDSGEE